MTGDDDANYVPSRSDGRSRSASQVIEPDSLAPVLKMLKDLETDTEEFEGEQKLIVSILERYEGEAQLVTIAEEMGADPHEIAVPIDLMHQSGLIDISGTGIQTTVYLTD